MAFVVSAHKNTHGFRSAHSFTFSFDSIIILLNDGNKFRKKLPEKTIYNSNDARRNNMAQWPAATRRRATVSVWSDREKGGMLWLNVSCQMLLFSGRLPVSLVCRLCLSTMRLVGQWHAKRSMVANGTLPLYASPADFEWYINKCIAIIVH